MGDAASLINYLNCYAKFKSFKEGSASHDSLKAKENACTHLRFSCQGNNLIVVKL